MKKIKSKLIKTHLRRFAVIAIPVFAVILIFGIGAVGFSGKFPSMAFANSGPAVQSGVAVQSGGAVQSASGVYNYQMIPYQGSDTSPYLPVTSSYNADAVYGQETQESAPVALQEVQVHILRNISDGSYKYTESFLEAALMAYTGWEYEGVATLYTE